MNPTLCGKLSFVMKTRETRSTKEMIRHMLISKKRSTKTPLFLKKKRYFIFEKNLSGHHGKYKHFAGLPISIVEFAHLFT